MANPSPSFLKGQSYSFARNDCQRCYQFSRCISASSFSHDSRHYLLAVRGFEQPTTRLMKLGTQGHEAYQRERGIPTLQEYGQERFFIDLADCKPIQLKEVSACSRLYGIRGHMDVFFIHQVTPGRFQIRITELKSSYQKIYLFQLIAYCLMFADPSVELHTKKPLKRDPTQYRTYGQRLINNVAPVLVNIEAVLGHDFENMRYFIRPFMVENKITEWGSGLSAAVQKRANNCRRYQRLGLWDLRNIPYCRFCSLFREVDADRSCAYGPLCAPIGYSPKTKSIQTYWGRQKLLTKSKPVVYKEQRIDE